MQTTDVKPLIPYGWLRAFLLFAFFLFVNIFLNWFTYTMLNLLQKAQTGRDQSFEKMIADNLWMTVSLQFLAALISISIFRIYIDRQSVFSLGFAWKGFAQHAYVGLFASFAMLGIGSTILMLLGHLQFLDVEIDPSSIALNLAIMLIVAFSEEMIVRGYMLHNLMKSFDKYLALCISAVVFALLHLGNPNIGIIPVVEIFIGGIMLGINYIYTKNLWFGIFLHFGWNFLQGPILGYQVSGIALQPLLQQNLQGPETLTGGAFGFEGSILAIFLNLTLIGLLVFIYEKRKGAAELITS